MSYVPKYVLKRMIPEDAIKAVPGGIDITVSNMIATIPADQIPGDPLDLIHVKVNGTDLSKEAKAQISLTFDEKTYKLGAIRDAGTIPVNTIIVFHFPSTQYKVGDSVDIEISVPEVNTSLAFTRTVQ